MSSTDPSARLAALLADRYRIERELGQGGMAAVYLAHDLRHDRRVAIKVLHEDLGATLGPDRFLAEIRTTARLQHPHILPLLDSDSAGGRLFYVMPYLEGESLRDRLAREAQLPIDETVRIAQEVADAIGYAHGHGIVHRDIKPENILLQGGHALVSDFGIALAVQTAGGTRLTQTGLSLGTPQYMAPEQAMGEKTVDHRADIYALGVVTYEMLTGEPPFTGATVQAIMAKVMTERPMAPTLLRDTVPVHVESAVLRALAKLPADRWARASEFAAALQRAERAEHRPWVRPKRRAVTRWLLATGLVAAGFSSAWLLLQARGQPGAMPIRTEVDLGAATALFTAVAAAPDGASFAYCSAGGLWYRRWETLAATRLIASTVGCQSIAFAPDGRSLAVLEVPTRLRVLSLDGSAPSRALVVSGLDDIATYGGGLDWASDGMVYLASRFGLWRVSPVDGSHEVILAPDSTSRRFAAVEVLPGARVALVVDVPRAVGTGQDNRIGAVDLRTRSVEWILEGNAVRFVPPRHLLIARQGGTLAVLPFDVRSRRFTGPAMLVPDSIPAPNNQGTWQDHFDVAGNGTLYYWRTLVSGSGRPVFVDRRGRETDIRPVWSAVFQTPRLSRDGSLLASEVVVNGVGNTYVRDLRSGQTTKLTDAGAVNGRLSWSPEGAVSITSDRDGSAALYITHLDQAGIQPLPKYDPRPIFGHAWSADGKWLVLRTDDQAPGKGDILAVRVGVDSVAKPVVASPEFGEYIPSLSPDGRWLAYVTNESGRYEVTVTSFPDGERKWQVSSGGGTEPVWSHSGRELFFVQDGFMTVTEVATGTAFRVGRQQRLFPVTPYLMFGIFNRNYDVTRDDARFLMIRHDADPTGRIVAVFNWTEELKRLERR